MWGTARVVGLLAVVALATALLTTLAGGRLVTGLSGAVGVTLPVALIYYVLTREGAADAGEDAGHSH